MLKEKLKEIEILARGQGLTGILNFRHSNGHAPQASKEATPA